jgi:hypothetical protein
MLRPDIDPRLEAIHADVALQRDRDKRYQSAAEMMTDLELYLYSDGYGPTNEKLRVYIKELFGTCAIPARRSPAFRPSSPGLPEMSRSFFHPYVHERARI